MRLTALAAAVVGLLALGAAPAAAAEWEHNQGVLQSGGPPAALPCETDLPSLARVKGCWEAHGDQIWIGNVGNNAGAEAVLYWTNYWPNDSTVYRNGVCVTTASNGRWARCDKDMHEGSLIAFKVCAPIGSINPCGPVKRVRT